MAKYDIQYVLRARDEASATTASTLRRIATESKQVADRMAAENRARMTAAQNEGTTAWKAEIQRQARERPRLFYQHERPARAAAERADTIEQQQAARRALAQRLAEARRARAAIQREWSGPEETAATAGVPAEGTGPRPGAAGGGRGGRGGQGFGTRTLLRGAGPLAGVYFGLRAIGDMSANVQAAFEQGQTGADAYATGIARSIPILRETGDAVKSLGELIMGTARAQAEAAQATRRNAEAFAEQQRQMAAWKAVGQQTRADIQALGREYELVGAESWYQQSRAADFELEDRLAEIERRREEIDKNAPQGSETRRKRMAELDQMEAKARDVHAAKKQQVQDDLAKAEAKAQTELNRQIEAARIEADHTGFNRERKLLDLRMETELAAENMTETRKTQIREKYRLARQAIDRQEQEARTELAVQADVAEAQLIENQIEREKRLAEIRNQQRRKQAGDVGPQELARLEAAEDKARQRAADERAADQRRQVDAAVFQLAQQERAAELGQLLLRQEQERAEAAKRGDDEKMLRIRQELELAGQVNRMGETGTRARVGLIERGMLTRAPVSASPTEKLTQNTGQMVKLSQETRDYLKEMAGKVGRLAEQAGVKIDLKLLDV